MADDNRRPLNQGPPAPPRGAYPPLPKPLAIVVRILDHWGVNLLHNVALGLLTFDSLVAAYRARSDPWTIAFVVSAYTTLMSFFWCVRAYEKAPPARKGSLMVAMCALALLLILLFTHRVASMMPFGFAVAAWVIGGIAIVAGFYIIFIFGGGFNSANGKAGTEKAVEKEQQS